MSMSETSNYDYFGEKKKAQNVKRKERCVRFISSTSHMTVVENAVVTSVDS